MIILICLKSFFFSPPFSSSRQASGNLPSHQAFVLVVSVQSFCVYLEAFGWPQWFTFLSRCSLYSCDIFLPTFCQYLGLKGCILTRRIQLFFFFPLLRSVKFLSCVWWGFSRVSSLLSGRWCVYVCVCVQTQCVCASSQFIFVVYHLTHIHKSMFLFCFLGFFFRHWSNTKVLKCLISNHNLFYLSKQRHLH